jgi:hypothetical protein
VSKPQADLLRAAENRQAGEAQRRVRDIYEEILSASTSRLWKDSINMLNTVSESVFSRAAHFILELLQNAEDACARAQREGRLTFRISRDRIRISHNGAVFTEADLDAICGVRSTKRPDQDTLGFLGIGFKSVFKITDRPRISSGGFRFKFDRSAHTEPSEVPWQILPVWDEEVDQRGDSGETVVILPFRKPEFYTQTVEELKRLDVHVFLFLKWIKMVVIVYEDDRKRTVIKNRGEYNRILTLTKNSKPQRFVLFRRTSPVPSHIAKDPELVFYKRQHVKKREVVLAFGVDSNNNLVSLAEANTLGSVSSFLPLVEERSGAKYLIQGDFLVQPGREAIQYELLWNKWLLSEAATLATEAIEEFKKSSRWGGQFLPLFDCVDYGGQAAFDRLFKPELHDRIHDFLLKAKVVRTLKGNYIHPAQAVFVDDRLAGLITDNDLKPLLGGTDFKLAGVSSDIESLPAAVRSCVSQVNLPDISRHESFLMEKGRTAAGGDWFASFFRSLAASGHTFRSIQSRDHRGRIISVDSPIYVLTDDSSIAPANAVYLRDIPANVIALKKRFPAVDKVLKGYKIIHPTLDQPDITDFLKRHTHVQSIDFVRICRDVFLPRLLITTQPPTKDDLIAYTRLLQKGIFPAEAIWVLTKKGALKPSNQVFLSSAYSPAEDWEKTCKYVPSMDFLSESYLIGEAAAERPAWKNFFIRAGVREKADNPYVRDFAMQYVTATLAGEVSHFIAKDHQQHGYDLDSERTSDGMQVALEVKGQKSESAVELIGNEPTAAKQAKQKGTLFWLCIVAGIPETPRLWVVEDPLSVGDFKTVTIDISKWKAAGRRVN